MIVGPKDYEKYYERYLWDLEEPVGNESAAAFYFVSQLAGRKVKVALTGQGADEPWAGYDRYVGIKLSELYHRLPSFITDRVVRRLIDRKSTRLNSSHRCLSYAVFCLKKKTSNYHFRTL